MPKSAEISIKTVFVCAQRKCFKKYVITALGWERSKNSKQTTFIIVFNAKLLPSTGLIYQEVKGTQE
jgi:hypothetical protein